MDQEKIIELVKESVTQYEDLIPDLLGSLSKEKQDEVYEKVANELILSTSNQGGIKPIEKEGYWVLKVDFRAAEQGYSQEKANHSFEFFWTEQDAENAFQNHYSSATAMDDYVKVKDCLILKRPVSYDFEGRIDNKESAKIFDNKILTDEHINGNEGTILKNWLIAKLKDKIKDFENIDIDFVKISSIKSGKERYDKALERKAQQLVQSLGNLVMKDEKASLDKRKANKEIKNIAPYTKNKSGRGTFLKTRITSRNELLSTLFDAVVRKSKHKLPDIISHSHPFLYGQESREAIHPSSNSIPDQVDSKLSDIVKYMAKNGFNIHLIFSEGECIGMVEIRDALRYLNSNPRGGHLNLKDCLIEGNKPLMSSTPPIFDQNAPVYQVLPLFNSKIIDAVIFKFNSQSFQDEMGSEPEKYIKDGWHIITPHDIVIFQEQTKTQLI